MSDAETSDVRVPSNADGSPGTAAAPPVARAGSAAGSYRVLARKYRPVAFDDLIGQDPMVRTLSNAFASGRIPQAWILTGVRGVGKTTTARIIARALNYQRGDAESGPSIHMPELGVHCRAIMESRHIDVIEMDAASHNGVDDVRQINEAVRYAPVSARYKVYILDEVHMLTGPAFNALLKTLEEPPPHAKFVFATTEIRKVPVTVLSRCQRFDLRRVELGVLARHLASIADKEGVLAESDALSLIARAAEGSVRDALSLLDQTIAHAGTDAAGVVSVRAADVRQMLGLADRARIIDLFEALMHGNIGSALQQLREQYDDGADPVVALGDLAEFVHFVTRVKIVPAVADDLTLAEEERNRGRALAAALPMRVLSRTWQMLLRGIAEVQAAGKPIAAAEMVLVRIAYAADLPAPEEVIRSLGSSDRPSTPGVERSAPPGSGNGARVEQVPLARRDIGRGTQAAMRPVAAPPVAASLGAAPAAQPVIPPRVVARFEDLIALASERRDLAIKAALEGDVRLVRFEDGKLEIALEPGASKTIVNDLSRKLAEWTGRRWMVVVSAERGAPTLRSRRQAEETNLRQGVRADPLVQAVLARFPGAEILAVRRRADAVAPPYDAAVNTDPAADDASAFGGDAPDDVDDDL
jgi:DNA polymerase-3 subunit gamma/tau